MAEEATLKWSEKDAARIVRESYGAIVPGGGTGVADSSLKAHWKTSRCRTPAPTWSSPTA